MLERLDAVVGKLRAAAEKAAPQAATICIVSDHGFAPIAHDVNLYSAFLAAGLFTVDQANKITTWKAMPWPAGGTAAVMLIDPQDKAVHDQVAELLAKLAADPVNGIARIWTHDEIAAARGFPDAAFLVAFKVGFELGFNFSPPLVGAPTNLGMHGFPPDYPEMRSTFLLLGPRIPRGLAIGEIDLRQIAPTLARILHAPLPAAELPPLNLPLPNSP